MPAGDKGRDEGFAQHRLTDDLRGEALAQLRRQFLSALCVAARERRLHPVQRVICHLFIRREGRWWK